MWASQRISALACTAGKFLAGNVRVGAVRLTHNHETGYGPEVSHVGFDDYDKEKKHFQLTVPEYFNFASDVIDNWARKEKQNLRPTYPPAFWWLDETGDELQWTFSDLSTLGKRAANFLSDACGVQEGERVIAILPRVPAWWLVNIASMRTGSILSPGSVMLTEKDIAYRLAASKATCIVTTSRIAEIVDKVVSQGVGSLQSKVLVDESNKERKGWLPFNTLVHQMDANHECINSRSNDPMTVFFTSGTTGYPKMAEHTHASYGIAHVITGKYWLDLTPSDIFWVLSDTGWAKSAYSTIFAPWTQGSCVFVHNAQSFKPKDVLKMFQHYPISVACLPPTGYRMLVQEDLTQYKFHSLRHTVSAGEPLNPEVIARWKQQTGLTIREGYGQTEMVVSIGTFRCLPAKPGSIGKASPGYDVRVINEDGVEVGPNVEGEIAVSLTPHQPVGLFTKYVDDPERTKSAFYGDYYMTGDRGYRDEDGYFFFVGRSDDVIISSGYRIGPFEVESALLEHPAVAESAVVSSPDDVRGEVVKAFVVLVPSFKGDHESLVKELQDHVGKITAPYKYPRKIEFVSDLPKTISGKIRRVELRNKEWSR